MANLMTLSLLTFSHLERSKSRSLRFQSLISRKGAELGPMLLLTINRQHYMASLMLSPLLTLSDLERAKSRSLRFQTLISHKGAHLGPMLLLTYNRKPYMASQKPSSLWTLTYLTLPYVTLVMDGICHYARNKHIDSLYNIFIMVEQARNQVCTHFMNDLIYHTRATRKGPWH